MGLAAMSEGSASARRVGNKFSHDEHGELSQEERHQLLRRHVDSVVNHREASAMREGERARTRQHILQTSVLFGGMAGGTSLAFAAHKIRVSPRLSAQPAMSSFMLFCAFFMPFTLVTNVSRTRMMKNAGSRG